jgi:hypothetical protein
MQLLLLLTALWASDATSDAAPAGVSCETVAQCWLDPAGNAIRRPKKFSGRPLPHGDCSGRLVWARHRLLCLRHRCQSIPMADMCLVP